MMPRMADVVIRGAGVFGLAIAFECARRGARVQVVDPAGVAGGASGGPVGALAPHVPDAWTPVKAFQRDSLLMSGAFWAQVARVSGLPTGYARHGRLQPVADAAGLERARARAEAARASWSGRAAWDVVREEALAGHGSWATGSPSGWWVRDTLSARLDPMRACLALAGAVVALGGIVRRDGPEDGACIVWATGALGLAALRRRTGGSLGTGVKGQAARLALDRRGAPQIYADALHVVPHGDGTVAVGSTSERDYTDATACDAQLDAVIARARAAVPALAEARVLQRWAGIRPRARSRAPVLGPDPARPGHFIANGGFKIGFGVAPKVAEVMADLLLDGRDAIPDPLRLETVL